MGDRDGEHREPIDDEHREPNDGEHREPNDGERREPLDGASIRTQASRLARLSGGGDSYFSGRKHVQTKGGSPVRASILFALFCLYAGWGAVSARAQNAPDSLAALTVFLDCDDCDEDYIRTEIAFVDYVRDRKEAQVHLLITTQRTGGGREFTLTFIGREVFAGVNDTLRYVSSNTDTDDERRAGLVRTIKLGLVRYVARTPMAALLDVRFEEGATPAGQTTPENDPWNFWVFRVGTNGSFNAEESTDFLRLSGNLSANRVTEDWKIQLSANGNYRRSNFDLGEETITSTNRNGSFNGLVARSLGGQWAVGGFASVSTSSFNNTDLSITVAPALEYNLFPYAESTRREFRLTYRLNFRAFDYEEVTVFDKTSEQLLQQAFEAGLEFRQPWGTAAGSFEVSNYLTDFRETLFDFYRVEVFGFVEMRLVRGLSIFVHASASRIRDQLFLPREEASEEDILLRNRRLPTSFEYNVSLGLSYTFGSIFNNVVNPRFGS